MEIGFEKGFISEELFDGTYRLNIGVGENVVFGSYWDTHQEKCGKEVYFRFPIDELDTKNFQKKIAGGVSFNLVVSRNGSRADIFELGGNR